ncbi:ABC transporter permease [Brachybacterium sacelli]|uniref:Oligopeptide transport system permease protein OppC n=1 Tax=Brachybacterium sacelli TaxID=173364 RepID=A0ABS4X0P9_9MICO|nr:ABC transporter permease [Brachybacterium sacelli]MBP2381961.1 peptide/nickel transport system permease protein [Brachybacterium sacelli]
MTMQQPADIAEDLPQDVEPTQGISPEKEHKPISRLQLVWRRLRTKPNFWIGATVIVLIVLFSLFGNIPNIYQYTDTDSYSQNSPPSGQHWFGTDSVGRDLYAGITSGLQMSLLIGFVAAPLATLLAAFLGSLAGYVGGWTETIISWFINLFLVLPVFYILLLLSPAIQAPESLPAGLQQLASMPSWLLIVLAIACFGWMIMAQIVKNQTKSLKEREFVKAARYMGVGTFTILRRHIIPNVASLLIIDATLGVAYAILAETSLSFFGLGIQYPDVSLGTLLQNGQSGIISRPWSFYFPSVFLVALLTAVALLGDALRDAIDPTSEVNRA